LLKFLTFVFEMIKTSRKIASLLMAFIVLFSTMSFTIDMHYCGDTLVNVAVFKEVKSCGMDMKQSPPTTTCSITKKDCCSEEQITFEGQDELQLSFEDLTFNQQLWVASYIYSAIDLFEALERNNNLFKEYSPPLVVKNIQLLDGVFLI